MTQKNGNNPLRGLPNLIFPNAINKEHSIYMDDLIAKILVGLGAAAFIALCVFAGTFFLFITYPSAQAFLVNQPHLGWLPARPDFMQLYCVLYVMNSFQRYVRGFFPEIKIEKKDD